MLFRLDWEERRHCSLIVSLEQDQVEAGSPHNCRLRENRLKSLGRGIARDYSLRHCKIPGPHKYPKFSEFAYMHRIGSYAGRADDGRDIPAQENIPDHISLKLVAGDEEFYPLPA